MRVLLAQNMRYLPSHGGANKSNRLTLEALAARGHRCVAVAPLHATERRMSKEDLVEYLGRPPRAESATAMVFDHNGVELHVVTAAAALPGHIRRVAEELCPDWTLVPSDDPGQLVLGTALRATPDRVVYLVHTLQQLPFGPRTFYPSESGRRLIQRCAGVVAVSRAAQEYVREHGGLASTLVYPKVYGPGGGATGNAVTMVNPCGYKGLPILLGLADACPDVPFLAVPTWGTSSEDRAELVRRPNITLTEPVDDIAELFARSRVVLMPSLWDETFGYMAVEAMLHGVPVLASDVGGLGEAKLGVPYLLPVNPISAYHPQQAEEPFPRPVVPAQDLKPWIEALRRLLTDERHYTEVADAGRRAASAFVAALDPAAWETYLAGLEPVTSRRQAALRLLAQRGR